MGIVDNHYSEVSEDFDVGQSMLPEAFRLCMERFEYYGGHRPPLSVLDLGSGTGRFSAALAKRLGCHVFGVDPNPAMLAQAREHRSHPQVTYLAGRAERIPIPDHSCDLAILYEVLHHIADRPAMARELARTLRPGGRVLIGTVLGGAKPAWARYFPAAFAAYAAQLPTKEAIQDLFDEVGMTVLKIEHVPLPISADLVAYRHRLSFVAISPLAGIAPHQLAEGFAALDRDIALGTRRGPVYGHLSLVVISKPPG